MSPHVTARALVGIVLFALACDASSRVGPSPDAPLFAGAPSDGNENKQVFVVNEGPLTINCGDQTIVRHIEGWTQVIFDERDQRNVRLEIFHVNFIFTNSAGEQFIWHDVGPDRVYVSDGQLFVAIVGRTGGHIGRLVVDLATGEVVFEGGSDVGIPRELACDKLT